MKEMPIKMWDSSKVKVLDIGILNINLPKSVEDAIMETNIKHQNIARYEYRNQEVKILKETD